MARGRSGSRFGADGSARMSVLSRLLHWLGPLHPLGGEEQQILGTRSGGGRSLAEGEEGGEEAAGEPDEPSLRPPLSERGNRSAPG
jgi:hypothetical protein